jgi:hypothetical protein
MDPQGQFYSPYVGMSNNPVSGTDPNGGWVKGAGLFTNLFKSDSRIYAERYASSWSSSTSDYFAAKAGDAWGIYSVDKTWIGGFGHGSERYESFTSVNKDGSLGEVDGAFIRSTPSPGNIDFDPLGQLTLGTLGLNAGVAVTSRLLSVGTASGRALFWSGVRSSSAAELASSTGLTTLEMTSAGSFLNATQGAVLPIFRNSLWRSVSSRFAAGASGDVFMLSGNSVRTGSVWMQVERRILMNNYRVTGIHFIK